MAEQVHLNGQPHPASKEVEAHFKAAAAQVWVAQTALGPPIKDVKQSTFTAGHLYWMYFHNSTSVNLHNLIFKVTFKAGSPLNDQVQTFLFPGGGYSGSVTTPFGVPLWGGNPILGPAVLHAGGHTYDFTVVP
jgi:hypothetical protein